MYGPIENDLYPVPGVNLSRINPAFLRKVVTYDTPEAPGTIVIDTRARYLYHVQDGVLRCVTGSASGAPASSWSGTATIGDKQEWPDWYPPKKCSDDSLD